MIRMRLIKLGSWGNSLEEIEVIGEGTIRVGDKLTLGNMGSVRVTNREDDVIGIAISGLAPKGCLVVREWR